MSSPDAISSIAVMRALPPAAGPATGPTAVADRPLVGAPSAGAHAASAPIIAAAAASRIRLVVTYSSPPGRSTLVAYVNGMFTSRHATLM